MYTEEELLEFATYIGFLHINGMRNSNAVAASDIENWRLAAQTGWDEHLKQLKDSTNTELTTKP